MYQSQDDTNIPMDSIIQKVKDKDWLLPSHQRDYIWNKTRKIGWIKRLDSPIKPVGVIVTYETEENPGKVWVNDGNQRIHTTMEFLSKPGYFGYEEDRAKEIVSRFNMPVQHRLYPNHESAFRDFQGLNYNEALTPFEFYKGVILYMGDYKTIWSPLLEAIHETMKLNAMRLTGKRVRNRSQSHRVIRHDYLILYRFLNRDLGLSEIKIGKSDITGRALQNNDIIEKKLRDRLEVSRLSEVKRSVSKLVSLIERETANIETSWGKVDQDKGISLALYRYLIELATWRYQRIPARVWSKFLGDLLRNTNGITSVINPANINHRISLTYGKLHLLPHVAKVLNSDILAYPQVRSKSRDSTIKDGYDQSHIKPLSLHGEGETITEPASENRSRGNQEIAG